MLKKWADALTVGHRRGAVDLYRIVPAVAVLIDVGHDLAAKGGCVLQSNTHLGIGILGLLPSEGLGSGVGVRGLGSGVWGQGFGVRGLGSGMSIDFLIFFRSLVPLLRGGVETHT